MAAETVTISALGWVVGGRFVPPRDTPWTTPDRARPPGLTRSTKLALLARRLEAFFEQLATMGAEVARIARPNSHPQCVALAAATLER